MSSTPTHGRSDDAAPESLDELATLRSEAAVLRAEVEGLRTALENRAVIEQAKGVLMCLHGHDAEAAFAALVRWSQHANVKLRKVAEQLVHVASRGGLRDGLAGELLAGLGGASDRARDQAPDGGA